MKKYLALMFLVVFSSMTMADEAEDICFKVAGDLGEIVGEYSGKPKNVREGIANSTSRELNPGTMDGRMTLAAMEQLRSGASEADASIALYQTCLDLAKQYRR